MGGKKSEVRRIKDQLLTLGLEEKRPTFTQVRKAFKDKVIEQANPDEEVASAVREVLSWLQEYPATADRGEEEGDTELLKVFESSRGVTYHDGCVTFFLKEDRVEDWLSTLRVYFEDEDTKEIQGQHGVQFKHPMWPLVGQEGERVRDSLSVTLFPSCSEPKVMVQGNLYLHFTTQTLPRMALSLGKEKERIKVILGSSETEKGEEKQEKESDEKDMNTVNESIKRLEKAFMEKMEASQEYQKATQIELQDLKAEVKALKESTPKVPQPQGGGSVELLSTKLDSSTKEINSKIEEVKVSVKKVEDNTKETASDVKKLLSSYECIHKTIAKMHSKLDNIEQSLARSSKLVGSQDPASPTKVQGQAAEEEKEEEKEEEAEVVMEVKKRKGIIFHDSIGKELDKAKFEEETNSKVDKVLTFRIKPKVDSPDPDLFVSAMVKEHMRKEHDFAVFLVGSNNISDMKDDDLESVDVLEKCEMQSQLLVDAMVGVATEFDTDVFVSELAPRYDAKEKDETGPLAVLSSVANSHLLTKVREVKAKGSASLHLVSQRSLARCKGQEQNKLFKKDGHHLTKEGLSLLSSNITRSIRGVYKDIKEVEVEEVREVVKEKVKAPKVKGGPPHGTRPPPGGPWVGQHLPPRQPPRHPLPPRQQVAPPHHWGPREPHVPVPQGPPPPQGPHYPREPHYPTPQGPHFPREPQYLAPQGPPASQGPPPSQGPPAPPGHHYTYYGPPPPSRRPGPPMQYTMGPNFYDGGYYA